MERSTDYPEFWVEVSTAKHKESIEGTFGYGYQLWMELARAALNSMECLVRM